MQRQLTVFRTELVPQAETQCASSTANSASGQTRQAVHRAVAQQAFGRDVKQVELLFDQVAGDGAGLSRVEFGVQRAGTDADLAQRGHLVVHQRDQRRDDHGRAGAAQRRHLVADALAAAGRHQHQRVATGHDVPYGGVLLTAKAGETENPAQHLRGIVRHGFG